MSALVFLKFVSQLDAELCQIFLADLYNWNLPILQGMHSDF